MLKDNSRAASIEGFINRNGVEELIRIMEIRDPENSDIFIKRLYTEISDTVRHLEETANLRQNDPEDKITTDLLLPLKQIGYDATHDTDTRGHVDIRVKVRTFVWLGEAKIHSSYEWLMDGLKQLHTRYSTGKEEGYGLIIYIKNKNAKSVMDEWRLRMEESGACGLKDARDGEEKLTFWSIHQHAGSGLEIQNKHIGVSLYYMPEK